MRINVHCCNYLLALLFHSSIKKEKKKLALRDVICSSIKLGWTHSVARRHHSWTFWDSTDGTTCLKSRQNNANARDKAVSQQRIYAPQKEAFSINSPTAKSKRAWHSRGKKLLCEIHVIHAKIGTSVSRSYILGSLRSFFLQWLFMLAAWL